MTDDGTSHASPTRFMQGLIETLEKKSPTLGTNAQYQRTSRIKTLPRNMIVQFVRFFWRKDTHSKAKIVKVDR